MNLGEKSFSSSDMPTDNPAYPWLGLENYLNGEIGTTERRCYPNMVFFIIIRHKSVLGERNYWVSGGLGE